MGKKVFDESQLKELKKAEVTNQTLKPIKVAEILKRDPKFEPLELNKIAKKIGEMRRQRTNSNNQPETSQKKQKTENATNIADSKNLLLLHVALHSTLQRYFFAITDDEQGSKKGFGGFRRGTI